MRPIIAVDFDGTLCESRFPEIGQPHYELIDLLKRYRDGVTLILWTCRVGDRLEEAVRWCREKGLEFDYVNENARESVERWGVDSRKIHADLYYRR